MKKILLYISLIISTSVLLNSCTDDDRLRYKVEDFEKFFIPQVVLTESSATSFSPDNIATASITVKMDLTADEGEKLTFKPEVSTLELMVSYNGSEDFPLTTTSTWPFEHTVTTQDLATVIPEEYFGNDVEKLVAGDYFNFSMRITMKDGTIINGINDKKSYKIYDENGNPILDEDGNHVELEVPTYHIDLKNNESGNDNTDLTVFINCPESVKGDLAGTYTVTTSKAESTDPGAAEAGLSPVENWEYAGKITITHLGGGVYQFSEIFGGLYIRWYSKYTYTFETKGNYIDICGDIQGLGLKSAFRGDNVFAQGSVDANGVITIEWTNAFGDVATNIYTPVGK